jgi:hypothetical protein
MTTPPDDNIHETKPGEGDQPEERLDFAIVPKENPDGTPLDPDETRRRLDAQRWLLEQLAAQHGLELREVGQHPPTTQVPTARANRLSREAQPGMDNAAARMVEQRRGLSASLDMGYLDIQKTKEGTKIRALFPQLEIHSREAIGDIVRGLASIVNKALPVGRAAVAIKVGWFKMAALVQHDGEGKGEKQDAP